MKGHRQELHGREVRLSRSGIRVLGALDISGVQEWLKAAARDELWKPQGSADHDQRGLGSSSGP